MSDETRSWGEKDKKGRRNCSNWVAAKSSFAGFGGVLQGLKPLGFAVGRCVAVETATYKTWGRSFCDHRVRCGVGSQGRTDSGLATAHRQECLCHLNPMRCEAGSQGREDCGVATARRRHFQGPPA